MEHLSNLPKMTSHIQGYDSQIYLSELKRENKKKIENLKKDNLNYIRISENLHYIQLFLSGDKIITDENDLRNIKKSFNIILDCNIFSTTINIFTGIKFSNTLKLTKELLDNYNKFIDTYNNLEKYYEMDLDKEKRLDKYYKKQGIFGKTSEKDVEYLKNLLKMYVQYLDSLKNNTKSLDSKIFIFSDTFFTKYDLLKNNVKELIKKIIDKESIDNNNSDTDNDSDGDSDGNSDEEFSDTDSDTDSDIESNGYSD